MSQGCLKGVSRHFQRSFKEVSRVFKESVKSSVFQENFKKKFQWFLKIVSIKFCCCLDLIAATLAEGGLV